MEKKYFASEFLNKSGIKDMVNINPKTETPCNVFWDITFDQIKNCSSLNFQLCRFDRIDFSILKNLSSRTSISFHKCEFLSFCDIKFNEIDSLNITDCSFRKKDIAVIISGKIHEITIKNNEKIKSPGYNFMGIECLTLSIENINSDNSLNFTHNNNIVNRQLKISDSSFSDINFNQLELNGRVIIEKTNNDVGFDFNTCEFSLNHCIFNKQITIEDNNFSSIKIDETFFYGISSFQNNTVKSIKFKNSHFMSRVYFDDLSVKEITKCDRKTIRTIKQELQKTENRIDYDTFRSYELELYKNDLVKKEKWWHFKDLFILSLNSLFSKHGISWRRAIGMTVLFSLGFYTVLYIIKNLHNDFNITLNGFNHFTSGYFKFFLITNFYDPLSENREYLKYFGEWLPFIFGKIVIGYGLYETVQSFRKYKK
ncbi:hypothetical protein [Wenyingzhuangia sp. 2_MG-2023]|uniref:hypothetical protein n=1 Tax=Wenyingzhuangia sp. 2_MG-2023 TaxID=3062639 RepID=UPI0026E48D78|nr:hypothetical protein [Wenyingzhuangia sp. 2_MG-2023]MDO6736920.1 hypothetical protein [Wenyingzhuangia sp. 2_MG-2023]